MPRFLQDHPPAGSSRQHSPAGPLWDQRDLTPYITPPACPATFPWQRTRPAARVITFKVTGQMCPGRLAGDASGTAANPLTFSLDNTLSPVVMEIAADRD